MLFFNWKNNDGQGGGGQKTLISGYLLTGILILVLSTDLAWASETLSWAFSIDNPVQFKTGEIELTNGVVRLKFADQSDSQWLTVASPLTLPDNAVPKSATAWTDMTGNMLLLHGDSSVLFQGTTKTYPDASGQNLSPTCTGAACPQLDGNGKLGSALWFDGTNDYLVVPGTWGGASWAEVTAEAWIRVDGTTTAPDKMQAIISTTTSNMFIHFQMLATGDKFNVAVYGDTGSAVVGFNPSAAALSFGSWHHVAVSVKSGSIVLYADGKVVGSSSFAFGNLLPIGAGQQLRIGSGYGNARFFKGALDEVAIYKRALSVDEIKSHYDHQSNQFVGQFDSRIFNVGTPVEWTSLAWTPAAPSGVQLQANGATETEYSAGNVSMSGNVLLAHLNETSGSDFVDASGQGNKGTCSGTGCPVLGGDGKFVTAASFDGVDDQISIPSSPSLNVTQAVTVEAWIYPTVMPNKDQGAAIVSKGNNGNDARYELLTVSSLPVGANAATWRLSNHSTIDPNTGSAISYIYGGNMPLNAWSHVVGTYDGSVMSLYVNGIQMASQSAAGGPITTDNNPLMIGVRQNQSATTGNSHFKGMIDEVAVYNRALSAAEVQNRFLRGALQPKFQVRACDTADCAGEKFVGPGNSDKTYYLSSALATAPLQTFVLSGVSKNPYFQYRVFFDSASAAFFPALKSVAVGPNHYPATSPTVVIPTGQTFALLNSFSDVPGDANAGEIRYQLSADGDTWYFCYGTKWQKTTDPLVMEIPELGELQKTNSALKVNQCAPGFASVAGAGKIFIKAFLHSPTATEAVELKQLNVGYELKAPEAPPPPPPPESKVVSLSDMPTLTVAEGAKLHLTMDVSKAGLAAPYLYICQANCPEGMGIKSDSGEVSWTPTHHQAGKYEDIQFKASDAAGKEATQALSVIVTDTKVAPKIVNPGDKVVTAGQNLSFTLTADDADGGVPSFTIVSGKQDGMEINNSTGYFSWTPTKNQAGAYTVTLRAVDGNDPKVVTDQAIVIVVNASESEPEVAGGTGASTAPDTQLPESTKGAATEPTTVSGCALIR